MLLSTILGTTLWAGLSSSARCGPAITLDKKPQIFVLSDISLQSPDSMSFVRLLLHSDQYNITGLTAVTSYWNNNTVYPDAILNITRAYGEVVNSLNSHSAGEFPTKEYLASIVKSGPTAYGTEALGLSPMSSGASHLIDVVDGKCTMDRVTSPSCVRDELLIRMLLVFRYHRRRDFALLCLGWHQHDS